jgi:hypothetical protein
MLSKNYEDIKAEKKIRIVRNEFVTVGKYGIPLIKKQEIDLDTIDLWCYSKTKLNDVENNYKTIHFFTYDWLFESVYKKPDECMEKLNRYYALLTPDFSMYWDMPLALQINSIFKSRWCGAYWQKQGLTVIPTVSWGLSDSFEFCFDGIEQGSVVAVSTYCREYIKKEFLLGYNKMLEVIKPSAVICYGEPFKEMKGNIKSISPYNHTALVRVLGEEKYVGKYLRGDLYPSR